MTEVKQPLKMNFVSINSLRPKIKDCPSIIKMMMTLIAETTEQGFAGPSAADDERFWKNTEAQHPAPGFPGPPWLCKDETAPPSSSLSGQ